METKANNNNNNKELIVNNSDINIGLVIQQKLINYPSVSLKDIKEASINELNREIIIASQNYPKIINLNSIDADNGLIESIGLVIWEAGVNMDKDDQKLLINYMVEEIKRDFFHLTLIEVKLALKKGLRGVYGDYFGINVKSLYGFLNSYVEETKPPALKQLATIVQNEETTKELTEDEKKYWHNKWLYNCMMAYDEYKEKGVTTFFDINNQLYHYIRHKMKLVEFNEQESDNIWKDAVNEHKRKHLPINANNYGQSIDFKNKLEKIIKGDISEHEAIKVVARRIALPRLFFKIKEQNIDFAKKITEYENDLNK